MTLTRFMRLGRIAAVMLSLCLLQACQTELYTDLSERDANSMIAVLMQQGIDAGRKKQKDGALTVTVAEDRFAEAVGILEAAGLPGQRFASLGDVFKSNGLVSSPVQERAQLIYAMSEELSHTVSQVDGVVSARVHVVLPENDLLKRNGVPSSASVFIRHEANLDIGRLIPQIKTLVAGSIAGLSYDGVSIVPVQVAARAEPAAARPMAQIMGIWLLDASAVRAAWLVGGLAALVVFFAAASVWLFLRRRRPPIYTLTK